MAHFYENIFLHHYMDVTTKSVQGGIYLQKVDEDAKQTVWQMTNLILEVHGKPQFNHPNTLYYAKK